MRRKDREITENDRIDEIIRSCSVLHIGFYDGKEVYIVPLSFGFINKENRRIFYFHSAKSGRKVDLIRKNPNVGFELDSGYKILASDTACGFLAAYRSVIGTGIITEITDKEAKKSALENIMFAATSKHGWDFNEKSLDNAAVFMLEVTHISCKENAKD